MFGWNNHLPNKDLWKSSNWSNHLQTDTLPETNIFAPENGWLEYSFLFLGWPIFRGEPLVSGSVDGHQVPRVNQFWVAWESFYSLEGHYDQHFVHGDFQPEAAASEKQKKNLPGAVSVGFPTK